MAEVAELIFKADTADLTKADAALENIVNSGKKTDSQLSKTSKTIIDLNNKFNRQKDIVGLTANEIQLYDAKVAGATNEELQAIKALQAKNAALKQTQVAQKNLGGALNRQRFAVQNAAFQFQDLAVSIQGGIAPSRALAQQVPQLLGGFGAIGAVSGLVAGLGFALAGPLVDGLFEAVDSAGTLDEALETLSDTIKITKEGTVLLSDEFVTLAGRSRDVAEVQLRSRLITAAKATNAAFAQLSEVVSDFDTALGANSRSVVAQRAAIKNLSEEYGITAQELKEVVSLTRQAISTESFEDAERLTQRLTELGITTASDSKEFINLAASANDAFEQLRIGKETTDLLTASIEDQSKAIEERSETGIKAAQEQEKLNQKQLALQQKQREAAFAVIEAEDKAATSALESVRRQVADKQSIIEMDAERQLSIVRRNRDLLLITAQEQADLEVDIEAKKNQRLEQLREKDQQSKNVFRSAEVAATADFLSLLANLSSGASRKEFERNKKISIVAATIKGLQSAVNAYEEGSKTSIFLGTAYASIAAAATGAQIAQIQSQEYPGRALGGQVRPGQAYRVGEFGPETLVMGSNGGTITPGVAANEPVQVYNNVTVMGGNQEAQVTTNTRQVSDRKVVQDIVVDLMSRPSSPARQALHSTSNVTPRGTR